MDEDTRITRNREFEQLPVVDGHVELWMAHRDGELVGDPVPCLDEPTAMALCEQSFRRTRDAPAARMTWAEEIADDGDGSALFYLHHEGRKTEYYVYATYVVRLQDLTPGRSHGL
ncbi:hypothetical protein [Streptomyces sp. NPDC058486]|uniref:hypothetical protein n=1 Tax=unclassified Streptomyces TaxID=2593676 RepID=UPI0036491298